MRFFKFVVLFLGVTFFVIPQLALAIDCIKSSEPNCFKVTEITGTNVTDSQVIYEGSLSSSDYKPNPAAIFNLSQDAKNPLITKNANYKGVYVCAIPTLLKSITQSPSTESVYLPCFVYGSTDLVSETAGKYVCAYTAKTGFVVRSAIYVCVSEYDNTRAEGESCRQDSNCKNKLKCKDGKCMNLAVSSTPSSTTKTDATATQPSTFGSGNVTCGNRTFTCTRGGWFSGVRNECYCCGQCTPDDLLVVGNTVLKWLFGIIGAVGLAMFVWGGFKFVTSAGSGSDVTAGKKAMTNAVIGLVIMFSAGAVVMWIQDKLGINQEVRVNITNEGPAYVAPTSSSSSGKTEVHGSTKIGEACLYNQGTDSSFCGTGLYCYSIDKTKGVCLPTEPEKTVAPGGVCYVLPGDGTKDMCKSGACQTANKTPGTKGVCPSSEENSSVAIDNTCKTSADCAGKNLFIGSSTCYKKDGSKTGKCIPAIGRNLGQGESCYVLPGSSTNDCKAGLLCAQNPDASDPKLNRTVGELGVCVWYKITPKYTGCVQTYECISELECKSISKSIGGSYCMDKTWKLKGKDESCSFKIQLYSPEVIIDDCSVGYDCKPLEGSIGGYTCQSS